MRAVLEGGGVDDEEAFVGPLCDGVTSRIKHATKGKVEYALSLMTLPLTRTSARITCRTPSAESWSALFHAMRVPYVRTSCSAPSTSSGVSAASASRRRLFVSAARSMRSGSKVERRMYVLEPCETAEQPKAQSDQTSTTPKTEKRAKQRR